MSFIEPVFAIEEVVNTLSCGLIAVGSDGRVMLWNAWMVKHSGINSADAINRQLINVFSESVSPAFFSALKNTLEYGLPVVLSTALHRSPLPLFHSLEPELKQARMYQSITIAPMRSFNGEACCLIQISDSSTSIKREKILRSHSELLKKEAVTDSLTEVYNRRFFDSHYEMAVANARRQQTSLAVFMIDIDHFKSYNDHYGHLAGDEAIKRVARTLKLQLSRATDMVARYGGEEFVVIMPHLDRKMALQFAEKMCNAVSGLAIPHIKATHFDCLTISIGVCSGIPSSDDNLLNRADAALYQAKVKGRNQYVYISLSEVHDYLPVKG